jgi:hypothetical protein
MLVMAMLCSLTCRMRMDLERKTGGVCTMDGGPAKHCDKAGSAVRCFAYLGSRVWSRWNFLVVFDLA